MQELARYWATEYDWRRCEAKLSALPHFVTEIDGLDIHFIHVRSCRRVRAISDLGEISGLGVRGTSRQVRTCL
jgi:hypothetical protein